MIEGVLQWLHDTIIVLPLTFLLLATGIFLTYRLQVLQFSKLFFILRSTMGRFLTGPSGEAKGEVTPYQALSAALAATVGTGNIAGVATAIVLGGPGAIFWMWVSGLLGMATKFSEIVLAVHFRKKLGNGFAGGPMYYLRDGLRMPLLALLFSIFGAFAAFGIGNMVQANSVAEAVKATFGIPSFLTGLVLALLGGFVILGGIKRIAMITSALVPVMVLFYAAGCLYILTSYRAQIPGAFIQILTGAFGGRAALGGFAGATLVQAWRFGIARGIFTNEAGLGSASIAHAVAKTTHPARQGMLGIVEVFLDTHVICTMTALILLVTGAWQSGLEGAAMTVEAFSIGLPGNLGRYIVTIGLVFFAFSTLLSWSYYGEKCIEFLLGSSSISYYRNLWIIFILIGSIGGVRTVWAVADIMNGLMAFPNLVGLVGLSGVTDRLAREYFAS